MESFFAGLFSVIIGFIAGIIIVVSSIDSPKIPDYTKILATDETSVKLISNQDGQLFWLFSFKGETYKVAK
jgi:hypothetical protein